MVGPHDFAGPARDRRVPAQRLPRLERRWSPTRSGTAGPRAAAHGDRRPPAGPGPARAAAGRRPASGSLARRPPGTGDWLVARRTATDPFWDRRCGSAPPSTGSRSRCCSSAAGRTCSSTRPWSSTPTCAAAASTSRLTVGPVDPHRDAAQRRRRRHPGEPRLAGRAPAPAPAASPARSRCASSSPAPASGATLPDWPPATPSRCCTCSPAARLGRGRARAGAAAATFTYDPTDPTPTVGGRLLSTAGRLPRRHQPGRAARTS